MESESSPRGVFGARLILGLAQGLALYLLYSAFDQKTWPATAPEVFAPLAVVGLLVPLLALQGLGNLRLRTLLIWTGAAALIVAGLAFYDVWHAWPGAIVTPTPRIFFVCAVFLFVAHALVSCGDADRRIVARYCTLFDLAWKLGTQIAIAACFVGSFWLMIGLGIALFDMIKLTGFQTFIAHPWVWIPLTTLATAVSVHITDTRANLVRGVRTLALTLLGWLLPVITAIAFAFLISLMVTGLQPLWETRYAAFLLMAAAVVLVIHINAAYQDGDPEHRPPHILRVAGTLASVLLIFIVAIAVYALWLRVVQYGWTVERITLAGAMVVAVMFAVGYLIAAILPSPWLKLIERWNVYGTFAFLIVLFALHTPIADPMRISVNDQVARLEAGKVKAEKFDYWYLRRDGGRFGHKALINLRASKNADIRAGANAASYDMYRAPGSQPERPDISKLVTMHPAGTTLPATFLKQDWEKTGYGSMVSCLYHPPALNWRCDAVAADIDGDGRPEIIIVLSFGTGWSADVFKETKDGWTVFASMNTCGVDKAALLDGKIELATSDLPDLVVAGHRAHLSRNANCDALPHITRAVVESKPSR